jgi:NAD(P)-dependent dehydrogenase (short-subunit alcohol dehydrogenase family)
MLRLTSIARTPPVSYTSRSIPDLSGRTAVVTGANGGLGLETAKAFAGKGAVVVLAARDQDKAKRAADVIARATTAARLEIVPLDLGSLASVREAAEQIMGSHQVIDILVNNAGVMATPEQKTADGFEMQFGVNHLGHWALTALLMPAIVAAGAARVVTVTSTAHHTRDGLDPANPHRRGNYTPWGAYRQSKLANYHFAIGLQREFESTGVRAASLLAHPGLSNTDLQSRTVREGGAGGSGRFFEALSARTGMTAAKGAMPQIRAATDPRARGGEFYAPRFINNGAAVRRPFLRPGAGAAIATLWAVSKLETGIELRV